MDDVEEAVESPTRSATRWPSRPPPAAAGGGIRFAHNEATLRSSFKQAQTEAEIAFKDGRLYMEKCIENFRHIEVQVLGDMHGNVVHLFERDCSVQRRRQKLIEESPPRPRPPSCARRSARRPCGWPRRSGYYSAGTVEFMLDERQRSTSWR